MTLTDCTVVSNIASATGGGIYLSATAKLTNTIVAQNGGGDVLGAVDPGSANNLVGIATGLTGISDGSQGNQVGTAQAPIDPLLASLGDYGGPTRTMPLLPGSPAISAGTSGAGTPTTDQRGQPRNGHIDIGAFQSQGFVLNPVVGSTPQSTNAGSAFANPLAVTVTADNPAEPVDGGVVTFAAPATGASAALSAATAVIANGQASITATADATPGRYTVTASAFGASPAGFVLSNIEKASLRLTTRRDVVDDFDGLTSLREAIAYANSHPGPDTITFDPAVFGKSPQTIKLKGGPLVLTDPALTTIIGPGAKLLTLSGGRKSRVFDIRGGSLLLSGMTISGGIGDLGGGVYNSGGTLALNGVAFRGNRALVGGAIYNDGTTTLTRVVIRGNRALIGSGLFNTRRAILAWRRTTHRPTTTREVRTLSRESYA
jgi:hypothetical protein